MALTYDVIQHSEQTNGASVMFMMSGGWFSGWIAPEGFVTPQAPSGFKHFRQLVEKGYTLVVVRHGSAPHFKVPDAVADVRRALRHYKSEAERWGIDPNRIGVTGASAGGHLSLMLGTTAEPEKPESTDPLRRVDTRVAAVVAYFPPVDLREMVGPSEHFPALDFDKDKAPDVSPVLFASPDDSPTLLVHGDKDRLVRLGHSERMHEVLQEQEVTSDLIVIEGAGHGFGGQNGRRASEALVEWFDEHLAGAKEEPAPAAAESPVAEPTDTAAAP